MGSVRETSSSCLSPLLNDVGALMCGVMYCKLSCTSRLSMVFACAHFSEPRLLQSVSVGLEGAGEVGWGITGTRVAAEWEVPQTWAGQNASAGSHGPAKAPQLCGLLVVGLRGPSSNKHSGKCPPSCRGSREAPESLVGASCSLLPAKARRPWIWRRRRSSGSFCGAPGVCSKKTGTRVLEPRELGFLGVKH